MFKKDLSPTNSRSPIKSSAQRGLKSSLTATYPLLRPHIDAIVPNKSKLSAMKLQGKSMLYVLDSEPLFFSLDISGGSQVLLPHLRLVHRYPSCFPSIRVDRGAIPFVLRGAALMAPGLTSKGGRLPEPKEGLGEEEQGGDEEGRWSRELEKGEPVIVTAEGKEEACAVGVLVVGTKEVKEKGKGQVIEEAHFLGDGLWKVSLD